MDIETSTQRTFREGSVSQRIIEPLQIYDPLLVLLKVKLRLNNWWVITGCGITVLLVAAILLTNGRNSSVFSTPVQLLAFSAAYVIMVGTYLSLPSAMADLFNRLWEDGVIGDGHAVGSLSYLEFVEKQVRWIGSRWSAVIALLVATLNPLFLVFVHPIWIGIPLWLELIVIVLILVGNYVVFLVFAWIAMMAITTHQLFRAFTIRVKPLHPDGSGGLGLFNRFLWITIPFLVMIAGCSIAVFWGSTSSGGGESFFWLILWLTCF